MKNDILDAIQNRRATFQAQFSNREIEEQDIWTILNAANAAPTHKRTQPWRFVVFQKEGLQKLGTELSRIYKEITPEDKYSEVKEENMAKKATDSNVAIAIVVNYTGAVPEWEELAATACAVQNMWLATHSLGLGGYWSSPGLINHIGPFLKLSENQQCIGLFYMGHVEPTKDNRSLNRTPIEEKVSWVS